MTITERDEIMLLWHARVFELMRLVDVTEEEAANYIYVNLLLAEKNGKK
jgi:hypothetical protein